MPLLRGTKATDAMKKYKVALIHNIIAPQRVPFFERLSSHPSIDLFVYFCSKTVKERKDVWDIPMSDKFDYSVLSGITLESYSIIYLIYHINPYIIPKLIKEKYDAVIIGGCSDFTTQAAFITSKLLKTPIILWSEGIKSSQWPGGIKSAQSLLVKAVSPLRKYITRKVDAIVVPGTMSRDFYIGEGAQPEKVFIAPDALDNEMFTQQSSKFKKEKESIKRELGIRNKKVILYVGQLIERKGVRYLIEAYDELKKDYGDACLVIIGDGPLRNELEGICVKENIKDVHFTGNKSQIELPKYYSIADFFVLPTLEDIWGLVVNEAMACGLPVISTKAAGCAVDLIIPGENGFIVDEANADQLCSAMKKVILDEALARKMGNKSVEVIGSRYTLEEMVNGFVSAIEYVKR